MQWVRFVVLLLAVTLIQAGLVNVIAISNVTANLLLILLVFCAIYYGTYEAIITSFAIGLASDLIVTGSAMGPGIISFGLFGTLLAYLHRVLAIRKMTYQGLAIFLVGIFTGILAHLLNFRKGPADTSNLFGSLLGVSLYSALIGPFLFLPLAWLLRVRTHRFTKM